MSAIIVLWLPILLSAVLVFIISSLVHMVFKWHAPEYRGFANEDAVRAAIKAGNPTPGQYVLPYCSDMKAMSSEPMTKKYREGPVGFVTLGPSAPPAIGTSLLQWFGLSLAISAIAAIIAGKYVGLAGGGRTAACLTGTIALLAYGFGYIQGGIWQGQPWSSVAKYLVDSTLYALGTAAIFWWLWP